MVESNLINLYFVLVYFFDFVAISFIFGIAWLYFDWYKTENSEKNNFYYKEMKELRKNYQIQKLKKI